MDDSKSNEALSRLVQLYVLLYVYELLMATLSFLSMRLSDASLAK